MSKIYILTLTLFFYALTVHGQKIRFFGVDSTMNNYRKCVQTTTSFEYVTSEEIDRHISIGFVNTEISYYLLNRFSIGGNLFLMLPRGERVINWEVYEANTFGGGFAGSVRWEFINIVQHNLFVESSIGMAFTLKSFPPKGTPYNFIPRLGFGSNIKLSNTTQLTFGYRWTHISNGTGMVLTNPSFNGNGLFLGFKFKNVKNDNK